MARRDLRLVIIEAAERVVDRNGMTRTTTRDVAAEAGCAEGSIYNHFRDRPALLASAAVHTLGRETERLVSLQEALTTKREAAATVELLEALLASYRALISFTAPALADAEILDRLREQLAAGGTWVNGLQDVVRRHIVQRQQRGELAAGIDAGVAAVLVTGACHEHALHAHLFGTPSGAASSRDAARSLRRVLFDRPS